MGVPKNIQTAITALQAFQSSNFPCFLSLFAQGGIGNLVGNNATIPDTSIPIIPFSGPYPIAEFLTLTTTYLVGTQISNPVSIEANSTITNVTFYVNLTAAARCSPTGTVGSTITVPTVLHFLFNPCGQIAELDLYTDVSSLALFYALKCTPV